MSCRMAQTDIHPHVSLQIGQKLSLILGHKKLTHVEYWLKLNDAEQL
jgi:hypothetical protein